ncbi:MAG: hypothetical protein NTW61_10370 [Candidatus Melainabacteria bacterium]|nr:hypothetical protein [Candidatus Melainabacteria bacterium]
MPRKTEEADSFEKQPQPPANRVEKNTVVPTVVATAILSPLLGALAGEWVWKWPSVDVEEGANLRSSDALEVGKDADFEERMLKLNKNTLLALQKMIPEIAEKKDIDDSLFVSPEKLEALSGEEVKTKIKALMTKYHLQITQKFINEEIEKLGENPTSLERFQTALNYSKPPKILRIESWTSTPAEEAQERLESQQNKEKNEALKKAIATLDSTIATKWKTYLEENHPSLKNDGLIKALETVIDKKTTIENTLLKKLADLDFNNETPEYPDGLLDTKFILESLQSEDEDIQLINERLSGVAHAKSLKSYSIDIPPTKVDSVASSTTQTVEASVKEGVQTLKGLGNWVLKPTETLEKAGGEALEKHATTSRWIAGGVALTTLLLGGAFAFFASQKKPQNQSANLNTSL